MNILIIDDNLANTNDLQDVVYGKTVRNIVFVNNWRDAFISLGELDIHLLLVRDSIINDFVSAHKIALIKRIKVPILLLTLTDGTIDILPEIIKTVSGIIFTDSVRKEIIEYFFNKFLGAGDYDLNVS